jgi:hypothetical protein
MIGNRRSASRLLPLAIGAALLAATAYGDVITKKDGNKLEGKIVEQGSSEVVIKTAFGEVRVPRSEIREITTGKTSAEEFTDRWAETDRSDADALLELADWCEENKLTREARKVYREIVDKADPDNERARRALGFVQVDGEWKTKQEVEAAKKKADAEKKKELADKKKSSKADKGKKSGGSSRAGDEFPPLVADFVKDGASEKQNDELDQQKLEDFFGQRFTAMSSRNFSFRVQLPPEDTDYHLRLAEKCLMDAHVLVGRDPEMRILGDGNRFLIYHVQQEGTFKDMIDWFDSNVGEIDPEQKKFFKDGGGLSMMTSRGPLSAKQENSIPLKNAIPQWIGRIYPSTFTGGRTPSWLQEGFGMFLAVHEFGVSLMTFVTNSRYENNVELADKGSDTAYKLICHDIVEGRIEDGSRPWNELRMRNLNSLDYVDLAKCWSLCDFFMAEHRDEFLKFMTLLRTTEDEEVALRNAFGWSGAELDEHWAEYVRENYEKAPSSASKPTRK